MVTSVLDYCKMNAFCIPALYVANVCRQTPLRCFNGTLCKAGCTVVGFYNGSQVANLLEDHFSQTDNTKMLFSQGV